jgi:hypothetical protein
MQLQSLLDGRMVRVPLQAQTKIGAIKELIDAAAGVHPIHDTLDLLQSVLNQDELHTCRIAGEADAEPAAVFVYARSNYCPVPFVGVGIAPDDIPLLVGRKDTFRILALLVAPHGDVSGYTWTLGKMLRVLRRDGLRRSLSRATGADEVLRLLCDPPDGEGTFDGGDLDGIPATAGPDAAVKPPGSGKGAL